VHCHRNSGIQGTQLWLNGCDPSDWDNYDKSDIAISGLFGAFIPGPGGAVWKNARKWYGLRGVAQSINRDLFEAAQRELKQDVLFQLGRGAAGAGVKYGYDQATEK
jgi:hypothetical protein